MGPGSCEGLGEQVVTTKTLPAAVLLPRRTNHPLGPPPHPATPYQRMLRRGVLVGARQAVMERLYLSLNPLVLSRQIEAETEKLLRLAWRQGEPLSWSPLR